MKMTETVEEEKGWQRMCVVRPESKNGLWLQGQEKNKRKKSERELNVQWSAVVELCWNSNGQSSTRHELNDKNKQEKQKGTKFEQKTHKERYNVRSMATLIIIDIYQRGTQKKDCKNKKSKMVKDYISGSADGYGWRDDR